MKLEDCLLDVIEYHATDVNTGKELNWKECVPCRSVRGHRANMPIIEDDFYCLHKEEIEEVITPLPLKGCE